MYTAVQTEQSVEETEQSFLVIAHDSAAKGEQEDFSCTALKPFAIT